MKFTCFHCKSDVLLFLESVLLKEQPETYQTGLCSIYSKRSLLLSCLQEACGIGLSIPLKCETENKAANSELSQARLVQYEAWAEM